MTKIVPDPKSQQVEIVAFLLRPESYGLPEGASVQQITTHISHVFLIGGYAFKLKRGVKLSYVDFSSPALRKAACEHEVTLNRRTAPELYLGIVPVTRTDDGRLEIDGQGTTVDWLVKMRAFDQNQTLDKLTAKGPLPDKIARALGDAIATLHAKAETSKSMGGAEAIAQIIAGNDRAFAACSTDAIPAELIAEISDASIRALAEAGPLLDRRRDQGDVRRCHADLHLGNLCLIEGRPVMFDCLEFDETLGTIDVLYDIAFLLMDLMHQDLGGNANLVFNRYLDRADQTVGLAALPLFLAVRAAIRAHVTALKGKNTGRLPLSYAELARDLLRPGSPRLIAIGGLSGSGKSTIAYRLAPAIGAAPGARVIRSDVIRKRLCGVAPETKLESSAYTTEMTVRVYQTMVADAEATLAAGHSVIVDAVFLRQDERAAIAAIGVAAGVPFAGLWLSAPADLLESRIAQRQDDASDADAEIMRHQLALDAGQIDWTPVDVSGSPEDAANAAHAALFSA